MRRTTRSRPTTICPTASGRAIRSYPAVICLHILDGNEPLTDTGLLGAGVAGRAGHLFKLPYYGRARPARGPEALADDPKLFVSAMAQAGEDIRRTIDLLGLAAGDRSAADRHHGHQPGRDHRRHGRRRRAAALRAGLILAGGDLLTDHPPRPRNPAAERDDRTAAAGRNGPRWKQKIAAVDPLRSSPRLRDRALAGKVLMINAAEDEVIPAPCTEKLANGPGHRRSGGLAGGPGPLHGDGRAAAAAADDGRFLRPGLAAGDQGPRRRRRPAGRSRSWPRFSSSWPAWSASHGRVAAIWSMSMSRWQPTMGSRWRVACGSCGARASGSGWI